MNSLTQKENNIHSQILGSINEVDQNQWDACTCLGSALYNPFISYGFLSALETSRSANKDNGWQPAHIIIQDDNQNLLACSPVYIKYHSYGEYVFDWAWAEAYQRLGEAYYPKLQCCVPFSPVTGPRLLTRDNLPENEKSRLRQVLARMLIEFAQKYKMSSVHVTFPCKTDLEILDETGFMIRHGLQFHWRNQNYKCFDDWLDTLSSRKRKNIKKEREKAYQSGVEIHTLIGSDIKKEHWDSFYQFYQLTIDQKWGQAYLKRSFFDYLSDAIPDDIVLILGKQKNMWVCGALNLLGGNTLFGRNWGSVVEYPMLHFEICYYQAIEIAIERQLDYVEAGAQGVHKISRGYLPTTTYSAHWIGDKKFESAIRKYLSIERESISKDKAQFNVISPYKKVYNKR